MKFVVVVNRASDPDDISEMTAYGPYNNMGVADAVMTEVNHAAQEGLFTLRSITVVPINAKQTEDIVEQLKEQQLEEDATRMEAIGNVTGECFHRNLKFEGHNSAPGYGQTWRCVDCGEPFWRSNAVSEPIPYRAMERSPELSIEDVI